MSGRAIRTDPPTLRQMVRRPPVLRRTRLRHVVSGPVPGYSPTIWRILKNSLEQVNCCPLVRIEAPIVNLSRLPHACLFEVPAEIKTATKRLGLVAGLALPVCAATGNKGY